jgi:hypothetical protein
MFSWLTLLIHINVKKQGIPAQDFAVPPTWSQALAGIFIKPMPLHDP